MSKFVLYDQLTEEDSLAVAYIATNESMPQAKNPDIRLVLQKAFLSAVTCLLWYDPKNEKHMWIYQKLVHELQLFTEKVYAITLSAEHLQYPETVQDKNWNKKLEKWNTTAAEDSKKKKFWLF